MKLIIAITTVLIISSCFSAETPDIKYGEWEISQQMKVSNMPINIPNQPAQSSKQCLTKEKVEEGFGKMGNMKDCKTTKKSITKTAIIWEATCSQGGQKAIVKSQINYKKTSLSGTVVASVMGMNLTAEIKGKYIGPCKK